MDLVAKLFGEAWEHRSKRRRTFGLWGLLIAATVGVGLLAGRFDRTPAVHGSVYPAEPASRVVARTSLAYVPDAHLGDHCAVVNSLACDSMYVLLTLKKPAISVVAVVGGRSLTLKRGYAGVPAPPLEFATPPGTGTQFSGTLNPSGTLRAVKKQKRDFPTSWRHHYDFVRLRITYRGGTRVSTLYRSQPQRSWTLTEH